MSGMGGYLLEVATAMKQFEKFQDTIERIWEQGLASAVLDGVIVGACIASTGSSVDDWCCEEMLVVQVRVVPKACRCALKVSIEFAMFGPSSSIDGSFVLNLEMGRWEVEDLKAEVAHRRELTEEEKEEEAQMLRTSGAGGLDDDPDEEE